MNYSLYWVAFILAIGIYSTEIEAQLRCRDENNRPVDWFFIYKIPKITRSSNPLIQKGEAYLYITSDTVQEGWTFSANSIGDDTSLPGNTLAPLYGDDESIMWTLYNDHAPNKSAEAKYGHSKGVVMANAHEGFWLVHSVPKFPPPPESGTDTRNIDTNEIPTSSTIYYKTKYSYPSTGRRYGQSFLCVSVNKDQLDAIGTQLMFNQILPYKNNLPRDLSSQYPNLTRAANKIRIKQAPFYRKISITSLNGSRFVSFAKSDQWGKDLYDDFVAPQLQSDLLTETWPNSAGRLPSDCSGSKVMNIESVHLADANIVFTSTYDHSKWAVTNANPNNRNWVCVGDINRAKSQMERGGGTLCLNEKYVWTTYRHSVNDVEPCPKRT